jgi:hypothetical protein
MSFESFRQFGPRNSAEARPVGPQKTSKESMGKAVVEPQAGSLKSWLIPAAIIVSVEYLFALLIGFRVGFHYRIPFDVYAIAGAGVASTGIAAFTVAKFVKYALQREPRPARRLLADFPRCYGFVTGSLLIAVQMAVLCWTKIMLPLANPFWADPLLANIDHAVFRVDSWRVAKSSFGWAATTIDGAYATWILVKFVTIAIILALPESRKKTQVILAYFLIMACTALGQYLLSSGGPLFYARLGFGDRFSALPIEPWVRATGAYLWTDYLRAGGDVGTGISAMPSLHVAIALWVALVMRAYVPRWAFFGFGYFALILIGSVLLGWHYAADGVAAIAITLICWRAARGLAIGYSLQRFAQGRASATS